MSDVMKGKLTLMPRDGVKDGEFLTGYNTKVMIGDQLVVAEVHMFTVEKEITGAAPMIMMAHPITGEQLQVMSIEFADGSSVIFEDK